MCLSPTYSPGPPSSSTQPCPFNNADFDVIFGVVKADVKGGVRILLVEDNTKVLIMDTRVSKVVSVAGPSRPLGGGRVSLQIV